MLAEECPKCHSPLMALKDAAPQCVVCHPVVEKAETNSIIKAKSKISTNKQKTVVKNVSNA